MKIIKAKNKITWISGDDAFMQSRSESGDMFKCQEWEYELPKGYRVSDISPEIEVRGIRDGEDLHVTYLTPETKIWVLDSAMNIYLASENPSSKYETSEDYFISQGWNCQPEPLYEVKITGNKKELENFVELRNENWGD